MKNTIMDHRDVPLEWAIWPQNDYAHREAGLVSRGAQPDPHIHLDTADPKVGRIAFWGGGSRYTAVVRAVVYVDNEAESLLLEDWTGWPWVRVGLDAELRESLPCP